MVLRRVALAAMLLVIAGCSINQHGPWLTPSGQIVSNAIMVEFDGFKECDTDQVTFIRFVDRQYAKDPQGQLGELRDAAGNVLTFAILDGPPSGAEATGVRHQQREIWRNQADVEDYLYIVYDDGKTERWPRAEVRCER